MAFSFFELNLTGYQQGPMSHEQIIQILLWILAFTGLALVLLFINNLRLRRRTEYIPASWVVERSIIQELLEAALNERSRMDLSFHQDGEAHRQSAACTFLEFNKDRLSLELPAAVKVGKLWVGRTVDCFFGVPSKTDKRQKVFYKFTAEILGVHRKARGFTALDLEYPERLVITQKRDHLRVSPPLDMAPYFEILPQTQETLDAALDWARTGKPAIPSVAAAWAEAPDARPDLPDAEAAEPPTPESPLEPDAPLEDRGFMDPETAPRETPPPKPKAKPRPRPKAPAAYRSPFRLQDVSAAGARTEVSRLDKAQADYWNLELGREYYVLLSLAEPEEGLVHRFLLTARIKRLYSDFETRGMEMGLRFTAFCDGLKDRGQPSWKPLKDAGVDVIDNWVFKNHLKIYRETGLV